ncbi:FAD-dependent monooxygenase [Hasllibacter sp. MH4015]|uniref:FAD-dependent monooxygenase n=1 Tax=Hasllibacter sp. MH4015 TaxID=2854029 RepID=UPI001CD7D436
MKLSIGICGGGVGGLCAAIALRKAGHAVEVFEKARAINRVGADINLTPNAVFALDQLGVGEYLRHSAARPSFRISRDGISGEETSRLPMSSAAEEKYGAPQLTIHRADLLDALRDQLPDGVLQLGKAAAGLDLHNGHATLGFADGGERDFDLVVGADGIHSVIRTALWGEDQPRYTGMVSYRGTFPSTKSAGLPDTDAFTKWWGEIPEKQIVTFPLTQGKEIFVFATLPQEDWSEEGWTLPGDVDDLRRSYANFHEDARKLIDALDEVTRSALHVRDPMPQWAKGRATLLGDAAHPMVPFMAQGACMAIEDAVVLGRALDDTSDDLDAALARYETERKPRTARVQESSLANDWLKKAGNADWVYGYDAWTTPLTKTQNGSSHETRI